MTINLPISMSQMNNRATHFRTWKMEIDPKKIDDEELIVVKATTTTNTFKSVPMILMLHNTGPSRIT